MARSGKFARVKSLGKKSGGLLALMLLGALIVSFSAPQHYSAHAAGWLDKIFGDYAPRTKRSARPRYNQQPPSVSDSSRYNKSRRSRNAYGIGKIDASRLKARTKKHLTFRIPKSGTTYRTMCVRTCDGFYFPVSFATGKGGLRKDARTCKSSCGEPARLYYYPNPGGEPEDMVSYRGKKKYKKLKNAFLFRKEFVADCRCKAEPWTQTSKKRHLKYAVIEKKRLKRLASAKKRLRKKRYSGRRLKKRRNARKYSRLSRKNRGRYIRRVGARKTARSKRRSRPARRTANWAF